MKQKNSRLLSVLLSLCLIVTLATDSAWAEEKTFPDAAGHWAENYIVKLSEEDVIHGFPDGLIHPEDIVSRGEFATMLANLQDWTSKPQEEPAFSDTSGHWAEGAIEALVQKDIIRKADYSGKLSPDAPISRIEITRWLVRLVGKGEDAEKLTEPTGFQDDGAIASKDKGYVILANQYEIIGGYPDHTIRPLEESTRAEAFALLCRIDAARKMIQEEADGKASSSTPKPEIAFTLPAATHTDQQVEVELTQKNANSVTWKLTQQTAENQAGLVNLADAVDGELNASGGSIRFKTPGSYTLTATAANGGKETEAAQTVTVYPVVQMSLTLPAITHTDTEVSVKSDASNADNLDVIWSLTRNGESAATDDYLDGALNRNGGSVRFKERGVYLLTESVTDAAGREYSTSASITCYPVGDAGFYLPEITHTDQTVKVETAFQELGNAAVKWEVTKDGSKIPLEDCVEGTLDNDGGLVRFKEKGEYRLKAFWTDEGSRTYQHELAVTVYPVPFISYLLPQFAHTDDQLDIEVNSSDLEGTKVEWLLDNTYGFQDWSTYVEGAMTETGGLLRFKRAGVYEIVARITDATGRIFLFEQGGKIEIHPVLTLNFNLPTTTHTDTVIDLRTTGNISVLPVEWTLTRNGAAVSLPQYLGGTLTYAGGKITLKESGTYVLTASVTDALGRTFKHSENISVYPIPSMDIELPTLLYSEEPAEVTVTGTDIDGLSLVWEAVAGDQKVILSSLADGELTSRGGSITLHTDGTKNIHLFVTATDRAGRKFSFTSNTAELKPLVSFKLNAPKQGFNTDTLSVVVTESESFEGKSIVWSLSKDGKSVSTGGYDAALSDLGGSITIKGVGSYRLTGTVTNDKGRSFGSSVDIEILNRCPEIVSASATPTRTAKTGAFLTTFTATAADPDGDNLEYEWSGRTADDYYTVGSHTVQVRAKDKYGAYSEWETVSFTVFNSAPSTPTITRTPSGNCVNPGTAVNITASGSSDPEGDAISYVWENRPAESTTYPLGKNLVRVKAVDAAGAESPWAAIVFFVADSSAGGGMTLTGPESVIIENGVEGATITEVTFTVPPVSGHSGSDYGRIRGYNVTTGEWDQLAYGTTKNGITLTATMEHGIYSMLEMYYYTNHDCMYNKSNITYSVTYYFE